MIDQRKLPRETIYLEYRDCQGVAGAIRDMVIRGAPAIGAAAAYGLALAALRSGEEGLPGLRRSMKAAAEGLLASRPTAVNLAWAVNRMMRHLEDPGLDTVTAFQEAAIAEAQAIAREDVETNKKIGLHGLEIVPENAGIVHHCNTGALATVDYGTALGVIRTAHEHGRQVHVYVDETRPRLQGGRLTAWELQQLGIPYTVIVDGASGHFMRLGKVQLCLVGCDRIAANGDTANKIGTYNLALAAYAHNIPFYVVGPTTTIDFSIPDGSHIPIEERSGSEVTHIGEYQVTPDGGQVANPAFDVTLAQYITGIITEKGIAYPPFSESLAKLRN
jgi:methylthioribose-1-phosphate isomerase